MPRYLSQEQIDSFNRNGYLVIPHFLEEGDTQLLLNRSKQLLSDFTIQDHPMTKFTTSEDDHVGDDYFLNSGDKIRFFLEEDAVDSNGQLNRPKERAVNKFGHALHELDPAFRKITLENERMRDVVRDLDFHKDPVALQSMVICKQPEIGGKVGEHNDSFVFMSAVLVETVLRQSYTFLYTDPPTALGFWLALEECTEHNGALSFLPGSHLTTPITKRFVRLSNGGTGFEDLPAEKVIPPSGEYVLETCQPGDLVLIHGSVLHKSERNTSQKTRYAYTFHMIDSPPNAIYDSKNWLQPTPAMPFSRILKTI